MDKYIKTLISQIRCKKARPFIADEIRDHIECQIEDNIANGMTKEDAERNVIIEKSEEEIKKQEMINRFKGNNAEAQTKARKYRIFA